MSFPLERSSVPHRKIPYSLSIPFTPFELLPIILPVVAHPL